jgi:hypothetical protein
MLLYQYSDNMEEVMKTQEQIKEISSLVTQMAESLYR